MAIKNIQTAHLVHDLKNPVNIIETGARSLLEKQDRYGDLSSKQEKVVRRMLRNALKIKSLAHSMLEVDMAAQGHTRVTTCTLSNIVKNAFLEVFDLVDPALADALDEAQDVSQISKVLESYGMYLEADQKQLDTPIKTDETKLCLVLTNLLSNALKYRQQRVDLKCSVEGDTVCLSVRDDGPGIPESYHQQIFDQYFQCVTVEGFPVRGHGLGLAGALALTEALGGKLSLCKTDRGAEFVVTFEGSPPG